MNLKCRGQEEDFIVIMIKNRDTFTRDNSTIAQSRRKRAPKGLGTDCPDCIFISYMLCPPHVAIFATLSIVNPPLQ